jgi:hypothetical protein
LYISVTERGVDAGVVLAPLRLRLLLGGRRRRMDGGDRVITREGIVAVAARLSKHRHGRRQGGVTMSVRGDRSEARARNRNANAPDAAAEDGVQVAVVVIVVSPSARKKLHGRVGGGAWAHDGGVDVAEQRVDVGGVVPVAVVAVPGGSGLHVSGHRRPRVGAGEAGKDDEGWKGSAHGSPRKKQASSLLAASRSSETLREEDGWKRTG